MEFACRWSVWCALLVTFRCDAWARRQWSRPLLNPQAPVSNIAHKWAKIPHTPEGPQEPRQTPAAESHLGKCLVEADEKVQCGAPDITAEKCLAIDCCFDGLQCHYGKAVTVQCTKDGQFVVVVARDATLPNLDLESVSLLGGKDAPCSPVGTTATFAIYQFPVTTCGTTTKEDSGFVIFENQMSSVLEVAAGPRGSITRDSRFELLFQCRFSSSAVEAVIVEVNPVVAPAPVSALGPLRLELKLANGLCVSKGCALETETYHSFYTEADYPVTKVLSEPVFVEVHVLERTDPNIVLILDRCWATSSPSPISMPQWDLLVKGCPYKEDRYLASLVPVDASSGLQYPNHYKRFFFKMFTFVDSKTMVPQNDLIFIHCSAAVCYPSATESCVQSCTRQRRDTPSSHTDGNRGSVVSSLGVVFVDLTLTGSSKEVIVSPQ